MHVATVRLSASTLVLQTSSNSPKPIKTLCLHNKTLKSDTLDLTAADREGRHYKHASSKIIRHQNRLWHATQSTADKDE